MGMAAMVVAQATAEACGGPGQPGCETSPWGRFFSAMLFFAIAYWGLTRPRWNVAGRGFAVFCLLAGFGALTME
jgi:hypothetical protein